MVLPACANPANHTATCHCLRESRRSSLALYHAGHPTLDPLVAPSSPLRRLVLIHVLDHPAAAAQPARAVADCGALARAALVTVGTLHGVRVPGDAGLEGEGVEVDVCS
jgi:hypothetical protein